MVNKGSQAQQQTPSDIIIPCTRVSGNFNWYDITIFILGLRKVFARLKPDHDMISHRSSPGYNELAFVQVPIIVHILFDFYRSNYPVTVSVKYQRLHCYYTDALYQGDLDQTKSSIIASNMAQTTQKRKTFQSIKYSTTRFNFPAKYGLDSAKFANGAFELECIEWLVLFKIMKEKFPFWFS
ncbi:unnamed protein product [Clavelina lepadiformis]|uniref:Uncharacterized protein n=1 Tax=Clavelina lepadiformis TaxID=159417 RepID=A0ABP0G6Y6_CLALP